MKMELSDSHSASLAYFDGTILNPRSIIGRIYVKRHITLLHTKYSSSSEKIFFFQSYYKPLADIRPWGVACMDPRGMVGRVNKEDYLTLLHT